MIRFSIRSACLLAGLVASFMLLSSSARADVQPSEQAPAPARPAPVITTDQLAAFAELLGEPRPVVWQRLQIDPGLVPFAVAAADARMARKSSGKVRTAVGFSIFGVGGITGYIVMLSSFISNCNYNSNYYNDSCGTIDGGRFVLGVVLMAASAGVGLGLGIPGIISMARQSEVETAAVDRYQYPHVPLPPATYGPAFTAVPTAATVKLPLLSLSF
jgi:hypothetical protein